MKNLIIYTRDNSGILTRHNYGQVLKTDHMMQHNVSPTITTTERLMGWPESQIEWHDNCGYGR